MALNEPTIDIHAFLNSSDERNDNGLGHLDGALLRSARVKISGVLKERVALLFLIIKLCHDWLNNPLERTLHQGKNKPAVDTLMETTWKRIEWEYYTYHKAGGSKG